MIDIEQIQKAISLTQQGKILEAEEIYQNILKENPDNPDILSIIGLFYVNISNFEKAVKILEKAAELKQTLGTISALGFAYFEQKNYAKTAEYLEKSLEFGENADIYNKLILSLFEIKSYKKAIEYSEKMYSLYPHDTRAITNRVKALTQQGKMLEAEKLCIESLKQTPEVSSLWFHLGFLKELIYCDDKQAIECYKAAAELGNPQAFYNIAVSAQKLGRHEDAEK